MNERQHISAFVDESGTHGLAVNKHGVSSLFVCVAVVVNDSDLDRAQREAMAIQATRFGGSELKSSGIGGTHKRRLDVLNDIAGLPIGYYGTIIDKGRIYKDSGLRFKPTFYKYMSRMLYERLLQGIASLHIVADEHGSKAFMDSFGGYLKKKAMPSLFTTWTHEFKDSADSPLIQVADVIAGTLAWCFDPVKDCGDYRSNFLSILQPKELGVERWPRHIVPVSASQPATQSEWDDLIRTICENAVVRMIGQYGDDESPDRQMQVAVLRHMLFLDEHATGDGRAVHSGALISHLKWLGFEEINDRRLRVSVIGPIRDEGVIIAGDSNGYRLAMSVEDIERYIRHDRSIVEPMLARLVKARNMVKTGTANRYDMLGRDELTVLREVAQTFSNSNIQHAIAEPVEAEVDEGDV